MVTVLKQVVGLLALLFTFAIPTYAQSDNAYQEALQRIEEAAATGASELDLSGLGLESLPPEIGQLANLTTLSLGGNLLTALPPEIGQLTHLTYLNIDGTTLPPQYPRTHSELMAYLRAQGE